MTSETHRLLDGFDVSRETYDRLKEFEALLRKWNPRINLVARSTLDDLWNRHVIDSVQLFQIGQGGETWLDMGTGGGFPGMVVAILAHSLRPEQQVTLMESDQRKCAFLRTVLRETGVDAQVSSDRIETAKPQNANTVSARALADLPSLLSYCHRHLAPGGVALLMKGATWQKEVLEAQGQWRFDVEPLKSKTEERAVILKLRNIERV